MFLWHRRRSVRLLCAAVSACLLTSRICVHSVSLSPSPSLSCSGCVEPVQLANYIKTAHNIQHIRCGSFCMRSAVGLAFGSLLGSQVCFQTSLSLTLTLDIISGKRKIHPATYMCPTTAGETTVDSSGSSTPASQRSSTCHRNT